MAITDKLVTVAENTPKVYEAGKNSVFKQFPESLKGSTEGRVCALTDISSIEHTMEVKLSSKNIFDLEAFGNADNWSVAKVGNTAYQYFTLNLLPNTAYTFSRKDKSLPSEATYMVFTSTEGYSYEAASKWVLYTGDETMTNQTVTFTTGADGLYYISMVLSSDADAKQAKLNSLSNFFNEQEAQLEQGSIATEYMPHDMEFSEVKLIKSGKNLLNADSFIKPSVFVKNSDGSYTFTKIDSSSERYSSWCKLYTPIPAGTKLRFSASELNGEIIAIQGHLKDDSYPTLGDIRESYKSITITTASDLVEIRFFYSQGVANGTSCTVKGLQLELGSTTTNYEPYIDPIEYQAEADGTVKGVTSIYPTTMLTVNNTEVVINCKYIKNIEKTTPLAAVIDGSIAEVEIPNGATKIAMYKFYNSLSLKKVKIPSSVKTIESSAFQNCVSLQEIVIPKSVTSIQHTTFRNCKSLKSVVFEEGSSIASIPNYMFYDCEKLEEIKIPSKVTLIGSFAFQNCKSCLVYDFSDLSGVPQTYDRPFEGISANAKIIVPEDLFLDWICATNWVTWENYITTVNNGFSFDIEFGGQYIANEGMTWQEWINSKYNTGGYYINDQGVVTSEIHGGDSGYIGIYNQSTGNYDVPVFADDLIIKNEYYGLGY